MMIVKYNGRAMQASAVPWQNTENTQKPNLSVGDQEKDSVNVVISKEGMEKYRISRVSDKSNEAENLKDFKESLQDDRFASRSRNRLMAAVNEINENKKKEDRYSGTTEDYVASMMEAYAVLYDEIIRGYEDGTRVTYEVDESLPEGCRLLTKEEELELLDQAYEDMVNGYTAELKRDHGAMKALAESHRAFAEEHARRMGRTKKYLEYISKAEYLERRIKEEELPENFAINMIQGAAFFKNQYTGMLDKNIVDTIFKQVGFDEKSEE